MKLSIGSGDVKSLLMGKNTKGYQDLMRKFVSNEIQIYNAFASPIDALRTGAILEDAYLKTLSDNWFTQYKVRSKEMDCLACSIDFALIEKGELKTFEELKTIYFTDFIEHIQPLKQKSYLEQLSFVKKFSKTYYEQIQQQLFVSGLNKANLVYLAVLTYDDDVNTLREINDREVFKIEIQIDDEVIKKIKERASIFQKIKDNFKTI